MPSIPVQIQTGPRFTAGDDRAHVESPVPNVAECGADLTIRVAADAALAWCRACVQKRARRLSRGQ